MFCWWNSFLEILDNFTWELIFFDTFLDSSQTGFAMPSLGLFWSQLVFFRIGSTCSQIPFIRSYCPPTCSKVVNETLMAEEPIPVLLICSAEKFKSVLVMGSSWLYLWKVRNIKLTQQAFHTLTVNWFLLFLTFSVENILCLCVECVNIWSYYASPLLVPQVISALATTLNFHSFDFICYNLTLL